MRPSEKAWGVLVASVAAYDLLCPEEETLSEAFDRGLERPIGKVALGLGTAIVSAHLLNLIPEKADPIHYLVSLRRKKLAVVDGLEEYE